MIPNDSIPHAFAMPIAIAGWIVFCLGAAYADAPPLETFTKPAELILTLSDDLPQTENSHLSPYTLAAQNSSADKFISNRDKNGRLNMDCGMNTNSYADTDNSIARRLSGECDLKYSY